VRPAGGEGGKLLDRIALFVRLAEASNARTGRAVAWLTLLMVAIVFVGVALRYGFALGWIAMQESYVWLHGCVFMLGAGYTLLHDEHVRVDIVYREASPRYKAWANLFGVLFLLLPMVAVIAWVSAPYVAESWTRLEASGKAGGLPGVFVLKSVLLAFCALTALQGLALAGRSLLALAGHPLAPADRGAREEERL
jgi:TRAP-type mannitol/chloroaromatic compound transport system permease small subunit